MSSLQPTTAPAGAPAAPPATSAPELPTGNRNSIKFLRACFKKQVLGGGRGAPTATRFWSAVNRFSPQLHAPADTAVAARPMAELQAAYDFVSSLLHDDPAALFLFLSNGTPGVSNEVPGLARHVDAFLASAGKGGAAVHGCATAGTGASSDAATPAGDASTGATFQSASRGSGSPIAPSSPSSRAGDDACATAAGAAISAPVADGSVYTPQDGCCFLCGRPQTTSNPVNLGVMKDLRACWEDVCARYVQLQTVLSCGVRSANHTHCRSVLRSMLPACAANRAAKKPTGSGSDDDSAVAHTGGLLDAMARCYPLAQLQAFLDPSAAFKSHRRCRGGLLSLLRMIQWANVDELLRVGRSTLARKVCHRACRGAGVFAGIRRRGRGRGGGAAKQQSGFFSLLPRSLIVRSRRCGSVLLRRCRVCRCRIPRCWQRAGACPGYGACVAAAARAVSPRHTQRRRDVP